jgi:PEP-CTERM motif
VFSSHKKGDNGMTNHGVSRLIGALAVGILLLGAPAVSQAINVTSVTVTFGTTVYCDTTGSCPVANRIWNLGVGGTNIGTDLGTALILTQTSGFNFDTSDLGFAGIPTITVNGITFSDTGQILNMPHGVDPGGATHQEATDWTLLGTSGGLRLWVGYADNAHGPTACADANGTCLPENPWQGSPNTTFLGAPTGPTGCVRTGITSCFDAGAIRIEAVGVPEPSSIVLVGTGLLGIGFLARKRAKALLAKL